MPCAGTSKQGLNMLEKLGRVCGATVVGVGLVVAVTGSAPAPMYRSADVQLTATVLAMGGLGYETIEPDLIKRVLAGRFANEENLVGLPWPGQMAPWNGTLTLNESVAVGLENMDAAVRATAGRKIVAGASGTTLVVDEEMLRLANDPTAPPADEMLFVVMGDANRGVFKNFGGTKLPIFDYTVPKTLETKYDVLVVAGEYDGIGDWPDRPWNLLAVLNALAGTGLLQQIIPEDIVDKFALESWGSVHYDTMFADLDQVPPENVTVTVNAAGGTTTTYLVPTADLPLLRPLRPLGVPQPVVDALEKVLRPIIDSAYVRNDYQWVRTRTDAFKPASPAGAVTAVRAAAPTKAAASVRPSARGATVKPASAATPKVARIAAASADTGARAHR